MPAEIQYEPISVEEAVGFVRRDMPVVEREISDFSELLGALVRSDPDKPLTFERCRILNCDCSEIQSVPNLLHIESTIFEKAAVFTRVSFEKKVSFNRSTFEQEVDFSRVTFAEDVEFCGVKFESAVLFCDAVFKKKGCFDEAIINSRLDFEKAEFETQGRLSFDNTIPRPGGQILLSLDQIGKCQRPHWVGQWLTMVGSWITGIYSDILQSLKFIDADKKTNLGKMSDRFITDTQYSVRYRWPSIYLIEAEDSQDKDKLKSVASQYGMLRDNFHSMLSRDFREDRCHYKYKDLNRRAAKGRYLWRSWDWLVCKWFLGYGIYARRIIFTAVGLILAFAIIYYFAAGPALIKNFDNKFSSLYFSTITFATIGYGDYAPLGWLRVAAVAEGLSGLLLVAVFAVSFARKLLR